MVIYCHEPCRCLRGVLSLLTLMLGIGNSALSARACSSTGKGRGRPWTCHPQAAGGSTTRRVGSASLAQARAPVSQHQSQPYHPTVPSRSCHSHPRGPEHLGTCGLECDGVSAGQCLPECSWLCRVAQDVEGSVAAAQVQTMSKPSARSEAQRSSALQGWFFLLMKHRLMVNDHSWA